MVNIASTAVSAPISALVQRSATTCDITDASRVAR